MSATNGSRRSELYYPHNNDPKYMYITCVQTLLLLKHHGYSQATEFYFAVRFYYGKWNERRP